MAGIISQGQFTAIGMRRRVDDPGALVINTCSGNDTADRGDATHWTWSNPTNRVIPHPYEDVSAVSVECLWQGTKILALPASADPLTLAGEWRRGKAKRPIGAYAGPGKPLITDPGEARRRVYIPAFTRLVTHWLRDPEIAAWVQAARQHSGPVYLRDHDTGRGVDRDGPMSHAWLLAEYLNNGAWPQH